MTMLVWYTQLEEEKRKVVAEWVGVEDAQREYTKKREAYGFTPVLNTVGPPNSKQLIHSSISIGLRKWRARSSLSSQPTTSWRSTSVVRYTSTSYGDTNDQSVHL